MIVGLAGYAGAGKDTAALALIDAGWRLDSFAHTLKSMALALNPWIRYVSVSTSRVILEYRFERLTDIVERLGWEKAKEIPEVREFVQRTGTEAVRDHLDQQAWVKIVEKRWTEHSCDDVVIKDARFPNEGHWIRKPPPACYPSNILAWIDRPGWEPVNAHSSDQGLIRPLCTHELVNDGTPEELGAKLLKLVQQHKLPASWGSV